MCHVTSCACAYGAWCAYEQDRVVVRGAAWGQGDGEGQSWEAQQWSPLQAGAVCVSFYAFCDACAQSVQVIVCCEGVRGEAVLGV